MEPIKIELKDVYLYSMMNQEPTALIYNGKVFRLEGSVQVPLNKTEELKQLVASKNGVDNSSLGDIITRTNNGTLIHRKPLNEIIELKEKDQLTSLRMATVLRKYYPNCKPATISNKRSGYKTFVNKTMRDKEMNLTTPTIYETVTEKDRTKVAKVVLDLGQGSFDTILKHLDMTGYKLKLILSDEGVYEKIVEDGKEQYKMK